MSSGAPVLDLDYAEDSACGCDMNVVMTGAGRFVEVQGTAEGEAFSRAELDALLGLAQRGIAELIGAQKKALGSRLSWSTTTGAAPAEYEAIYAKPERQADLAAS